MSPGHILEGMLFRSSSELWTDVFIIAIVGVFFLALYAASKKKHSRFLEHAPNVMTSLGIPGTFLGIVVGLLHFDPNQIDSSITSLLAQLFPAFIRLKPYKQHLPHQLLDTQTSVPRMQ